MINLNSKMFLVVCLLFSVSANAFDRFGVGALGKTRGFHRTRARGACGEKRAYFYKALALEQEIVLFEGRASFLLYYSGETKYRCNGVGCFIRFETGRRAKDGKDEYEAFDRHMRGCLKPTHKDYQEEI